MPISTVFKLPLDKRRECLVDFGDTAMEMLLGILEMKGLGTPVERLLG